MLGSDSSFVGGSPAPLAPAVPRLAGPNERQRNAHDQRVYLDFKTAIDQKKKTKREREEEEKKVR